MLPNGQRCQYGCTRSDSGVSGEARVRLWVESEAETSGWKLIIFTL